MQYLQLVHEYFQKYYKIVHIILQYKYSIMVLYYSLYDYHYQINIHVLVLST